MNNNTAHILIRLNNDFYRQHAGSFSATRTFAWAGWKRVLQSVEAAPRSVVDLACGNLRFKSFLDEAAPCCERSYHAVDACRPLVPPREDVAFHEVDILQKLLDHNEEGSLAPPADLAVCWGFMHHVPGTALRLRVLEELLACTLPGAIAAVSFWQFANDSKLAARAQRTTAEAQAKLGLPLESGDYLIGWNELPDVWRYCHSFSAEEVDSLAAAVAQRADVIDRFEADGRNNALNGYLVFRRR